MMTNRPTDNSSGDDGISPERLPCLPDEIRYQYIPSFSLKLCGMFAQTSVDAELATAFLRLLPNAVDAEPESYKQEDETKLAALAILKRHRELLFRKGI